MEELVFKSQKGTPVTNSLLVAEKFGKQHKDVLEAIRNLVTTAENSAVLSMFYETTYYNEQNKPQPLYVMNRNGFSLLVMGFTGTKALQFKVEYIEAFENMENVIKTGGFQIPKTMSEALLFAAKQHELIEAQQKRTIELEHRNAAMAPKVIFFDTVLEPANECIDIGQAAKILKLPYGRNTLFRVLREKGIFFKNKNEPKQEYIDRGYFKLYEKSIPRSNHPSLIVITVLVTQKGLLFLSKVLETAIEEKSLMAIQ